MGCLPETFPRFQATNSKKGELYEKGKRPELVDAAELWGLDTYATDERIRKKYGSCETARIGPAGENMVKYANIFSGAKRTGCSGRAGMGCVMGSKNLKAVIVITPPQSGGLGGYEPPQGWPENLFIR